MFRLVIGFIVGVIVSRNAQQYSTPYWGAIIFGVLIGATFFYFFGRRDKNIAVATAVATAVSNANAKAAAVAQSAVNVYMQSGQIPSQPEIAAIIDHTEIDYDNASARYISSQRHGELAGPRNPQGSDLPIHL